MHRHQQRVLAGTQLDQSPSHKRPGFQIEGPYRLFSRQPFQFSGCAAVLAQIMFFQSEADVLISNVLNGLAIDHNEGSAQGFVASHQTIE
jgi:hypothetical protein